MHPVRWAWILEALDGQQRPQITTGGTAVNTPAVTTEPTAEGAAGTVAGLPVYLDANISLTANGTSGTTAQDEIYVLRRDDVWLWETQPLMESFDATYADQLSVLFRAVGWSAFIPNRYTGSIQSVRGTGMVNQTL